MRITIKYKNIDPTPALDAYVERKIGSLSKFMKTLEANREILAEVELARPNKHHNKGEVFYAEVNMNLPGKLLRASQKDYDMRVAIDGVKDDLQRQIKKDSDKRRARSSKNARAVRKLKNK